MLMDLPAQVVPNDRSLVALERPANDMTPPPWQLARQIEASAFAFCFVGLPLLPFVVPEGAQALILFGTLAAYGARLAQGRSVPVPLPAALTAVAFLGWCGLTLLWSERPDRALGWLGQIMLVLPSAILLTALAASASRETARAAGWALALGVTGAAGFVFVDLVTSGALQMLLPEAARSHRVAVTRPMIVVALLCWPAAALLHRQGARTAAALVTALPTLPLLMGASDTAALVFGVGAAVFVCAGGAPGAVAGLVVFVGLGGIMLAPVLVGFVPGLVKETLVTFVPAVGTYGLGAGFPPQIFWERFDIWSASVRLIGEAPLQGQGLGSMRNHPLPEIAWLGAERRILHPHNGALQAWLDLGIAGAVFLCLGFLATLQTAGRRPIALAGVAALLTGMIAPWSLWAGWWIATMAGLVAALALVRRAA